MYQPIRDEYFIPVFAKHYSEDTILRLIKNLMQPCDRTMQYKSTKKMMIPDMDGTSCDNARTSGKKTVTHDSLDDGTLASTLTSDSNQLGKPVSVAELCSS